MNIESTCGCGARIALTPGSPSSLGNSHGYASNNTGTVDAERQAVAAAFEKWVEAHQQCAQPRPVAYPFTTYPPSCYPPNPEREPDVDPARSAAPVIP